MAQLSDSVILQGGLNLVTPQLAMPPGMAIAALNYEPEARGYRRLGGYERFDGQPSPHLGADAAAISTRRAAIGKPPGAGPVRGVYTYDNFVYAFRDSVTGEGQMFKATGAGWEKQTFGQEATFSTGKVEILEGDTITGATSGATAVAERVVNQSGVYHATTGTAAGYLVLSTVTGTFVSEVVNSSSGGQASILPPDPIVLFGGGHFDFVIHNFYGAARRPCLYFVNGIANGYEWDGEVLSPIRTGNAAGTLDDLILVLAANGDTILAANGDRVLMVGDPDKPTHIGQYSNHLFLTFSAGSMVHSGIGEPLDYRAVAGAGEISFGGMPTGLLSSVSTSLVVFGQSRVEYMVGNDSLNFELKPISDAAGAVRWSAQMSGEAPLYLDEAGLRKLNTTAAFGDWCMGTISQLVEPLFRAKRDANVLVAASVNVKNKDQYRLFFDDGTGVILYLGRKNPESMPIKTPMTVLCACSGEISEGAGERIFVGATDGYVYELDKGTSFDGAPVPAYIRLSWNNTKAPNQEKRFIKATFETDNETDMLIGVLYHTDYNATENLSDERRNYDVAAGATAFMPTADFGTIDWTLASAGFLEAYLDGLGRSIAITLVSEHTNEEPHTLAALTLNYSPRRLVR